MSHSVRCSLALAAALLAGCVSVQVGGDGARHLRLVLQDARPTMPARNAPVASALQIQPLPADPLADTQSIAYSRTPGVREFYQLASWTELPLRAIPRLLQQRLETRGSFAAVAPLGQPIDAPWLLAVAVESIYHDAQSGAGSARLTLRVELIDRTKRRLAARRTFSASASLDQANSTEAAAAMGRALADIFDALVPWLEEQALQLAPDRAARG